MAVSKTDSLYEALATSILKGQRKGGSRLPSEQELCDEFGVSRITVRAAIERLRADRVVYSIQGSGSFVGWVPEHPDEDAEPAANSGPMHLRHSFELIRCLEAEAAGLAALRRTDEDIDRLKLTLDRQCQAESLIDLRREDIRFHEQVIWASKNPLFIKSLAEISPQDAGVVAIWDGDKHPNLWECKRRSVDPHRTIFHAIEMGDAATARAAMRFHLDQMAPPAEQQLS